MRKRGRPSSNELANLVVLDGSRRLPPAPSELTDAQAAVWRNVVATLPGDWIDESSSPVLVEYCRHVCRARLLEGLVRKFEAEWVAVEGGLERLDKLLAIAERETRAMTACARALRLTPQARIHPRTAGRRLDGAAAGVRRPWDED
jgi:phage terminase small subunit